MKKKHIRFLSSNELVKKIWYTIEFYEIIKMILVENMDGTIDINANQNKWDSEKQVE